MKTKEYPTQEFLREKFIYKDGYLYKRISKDLDGNEFGKKYLSRTGTEQGYYCIEIKTKKFLTHRLIWIYHFGEMLNSLQIDHINGNKIDNNINNLRLVTQTENNRNASIRKDNISGNQGVSWSNRDKVWYARIGINYLGTFKNLEDAIKVRKEAEILYGYHPNHGREQINEVGQ